MTWPSRSQMLFLALVTSLGLNDLQGFRILNLEEAIEVPLSGAVLEEGTHLTPLDLRDDSSKRIVIGYDSVPKPTLLYVYSASCPWCERNATSFRTLAAQTKDAFRLVGISLSPDGIKAHRDLCGMDLPIYTPSPSTLKSYHLGKTPTTILVSQSGLVLKVWSGAYTGAKKASIESYFHLKLPSL
jgi:hypothetical protein